MTLFIVIVVDGARTTRYDVTEVMLRREGFSPTDCIPLKDRHGAEMIIVINVRDGSTEIVKNRWGQSGHTTQDVDTFKARLDEKDKLIHHLTVDLIETSRMRDVYRKAKEENDDRFIQERNEARRRYSELLEEVKKLALHIPGVYF